MSIYAGNTKVSAVYIGNAKARMVFSGTTLVWPEVVYWDWDPADNVSDWTETSNIDITDEVDGLRFTIGPSANGFGDLHMDSYGIADKKFYKVTIKTGTSSASPFSTNLAWTGTNKPYPSPPATLADNSTDSDYYRGTGASFTFRPFRFGGAVGSYNTLEEFRVDELEETSVYDTVNLANWTRGGTGTGSESESPTGQLNFVNSAGSNFWDLDVQTCESSTLYWVGAYVWTTGDPSTAILRIIDNTGGSDTILGNVDLVAGGYEDTPGYAGLFVTTGADADEIRIQLRLQTSGGSDQIKGTKFEIFKIVDNT